MNVRRPVVAFLAGLLLIVGAAAPASAHATLLEARPADGTVLPQAPAEVSLRYDQPVGTSLGAVKLLAPSGSEIATGPVVTREGGRVVFASLTNRDLAPGTYTILWRVLSQDSHTISGASTFSVGQASATSVDTDQQTSGDGGAAKTALDVARFLLYAGLVLLIGGLAFLHLLWPEGAAVPAARRVPRAGWGLAVVGSLGGLLVQGPYAAGRALTAVADPSLLEAVVQTRYGIATGVRLGLLLLLALTIRWMPRGRVPVAVLGVGILATVSVVGHAGSGSLTELAVAADVLHLVAMSAWLGGLVLLAAVVLRQPAADLAGLLPRWSRYAACAVVLLVVTGTFAGWREVRELGALTGTDYGGLLLVKTALVVGMLLLAAVGRGRIARAARPPEPAAEPPLPTGGVGTLTRLPAPAVSPVALRRGVLLETVLAVVVLAVTAVLVATVPARETYSPTFTQSAPVSAAVRMTLTVAPARAGLNDVRVDYTAANGAPTDVVSATARWTRPGSSDVVPVQLARSAAGSYARPRVAVPTAGTWNLTVTTQTSDIDSVSIRFTVRVR